MPDLDAAALREIEAKWAAWGLTNSDMSRVVAALRELAGAVLAYEKARTTFGMTQVKKAFTARDAMIALARRVVGETK